MRFTLAALAVGAVGCFSPVPDRDAGLQRGDASTVVDAGGSTDDAGTIDAGPTGFANCVREEIPAPGSNGWLGIGGLALTSDGRPFFAAYTFEPTSAGPIAWVVTPDGATWQHTRLGTFVAGGGTQLEAFGDAPFPRAALHAWVSHGEGYFECPGTTWDSYQMLSSWSGNARSVPSSDGGLHLLGGVSDASYGNWSGDRTVAPVVTTETIPDLDLATPADALFVTPSSNGDVVRVLARSQGELWLYTRAQGQWSHESLLSSYQTAIATVDSLGQPVICYVRAGATVASYTAGCLRPSAQGWVNTPLFVNQQGASMWIQGLAVDSAGALHLLIVRFTSTAVPSEALHVTQTDGGWLSESSEPITFGWPDTARFVLNPVTQRRHFAYRVENKLIHLSCPP